jgi:hypothetical protein
MPQGGGAAAMKGELIAAIGDRRLTMICSSVPLAYSCREQYGRALT